MPATEQTWRDSKLMHLIFGISSLAMLITTIWMLAADHRREWKDYQRKFQNVEAWTLQSRISQQESAQYEKDKKEATEALENARKEVPKAALVNEFEDTVREHAEAHRESVNLKNVDDAYLALSKAPENDRPALREKFLESLRTIIAQARFVEEGKASVKKFRAADLDVARSQFELGVGNELAREQLDQLQKSVDAVMAQVDTATAELQDATTYRKSLESTYALMTADEATAAKALEDQISKLTQLEKALYERENHVMKEVVELPILDAFGRPIKIDQIWLPKLTLNNNFRDVARFDRCTTCHQAMDKTAPGSATEPGYPQQHSVAITLPTPAESPLGVADRPTDPEKLNQHYDRVLQEIYGMQLAKRGLFDESDPTISVLLPEQPAAKAKLEVGDVIETIGGVKMLDKGMVYNYLLESVQWGQPLNLTVRRGLPNPYSSHPRLDLFVGSLSPHKMADVGCTICHEGQGSATSFKWASHTPNDPIEADRWKREHGWFDNHHWIFPMTPRRFSESTCLKCHHDVTELAASEKFPDPPAPKLMEGFNLIQDVGCFGCHEINGFDGPNRRVGPDLRAEPNYTAAAEALLFGGGLSDEQQGWAREVVAEPSNDAARHSLQQSLKNAETLPGQPEVTRRLVNLLDDVESPGRLRKVGPSLRHVGSKVGFEFLYSWIRKPTDFRPTTKMPQFFGQFDHLDGVGLEESLHFEPIEIRGITEFLLARSQPLEYTPRPKSVTVEASAERGKQLFETRGCLACHQHSDFPAGKMTQGPDLSRVGGKLGPKNDPNGGKWLYTWLRNPNKSHPRTLMPNLILDPTKGADGKLIDPAADITQFLLQSQPDWAPADVPARETNDAENGALEDLAMEYLKTVFPKRQAAEFLKTGIPEELRKELKGDEVELIGEMSPEKKLRYVGRRSISKYGCAGCHDIPGFEDAKPIGTGLADWARKTPDKLAFEQIVEYMKHGHGKPGAHKPPAKGDVTDQEIEQDESGTYGHGEHFIFKNMPPDTGYFMEKLIGHQREGFIWQKLREPRSFDYEKTQNKGYNERLRMPKFTVLDDAQRESIITFVLGLVAEPPAPQYVFKPTPRRQAIVQGLQVVEKFNCTGCHAFSMDQWKLAYEGGDFADPPEIGDYPFLQAHFTPQQIKASLETDDRGLRHATVTGMPMVNEAGEVLRYDEDGAPLEADDTATKAFYSFVLWENVLLNGQPRQAGLQNILIPEARIEKRLPPMGGFLPRLAYPVVVAAEKAVNPNAKPEEAWGWLPPPLVGEGRKVQPEWLHNFLLDPFPIRPAVVLRMPKFNMSPSDASKLVNYFAAVDGVDYPYDFDPRTRDTHLSSANAKHPDHLGDALKIITDNNYCVKCHLVGDFVPEGSERAKAPRLDAVYKRLRGDFTLDWVANPKRILPYTGMPVNVPYDKPVSQSLFPGTSMEQLNGLVDLLLNFDRFMENKTSIKSMVKAPPPEAKAEKKDPADDKKQAAVQ